MTWQPFPILLLFSSHLVVPQTASPLQLSTKKMRPLLSLTHPAGAPLSKFTCLNGAFRFFASFLHTTTVI